MIGWLGDAYPWVKAAHLIVVIFWIAGLFMLPRFLVYHMAAAAGSPEDGLWVERETRLRRIILHPSIALVWLLGLALVANIGLEGQDWLHIKLALVVALSGYHAWLGGLAKAFARGERPLSERALRLANEVPGLATVSIVILVIVKPF